MLNRVRPALPRHSSDESSVHHESVRTLRAAEFMRIDALGRVCQVIAHDARAG
jgi:hypothetical protein